MAQLKSNTQTAIDSETARAIASEATKANLDSNGKVIERLSYEGTPGGLIKADNNSALANDGDILLFNHDGTGNWGIKTNITADTAQTRLVNGGAVKILTNYENLDGLFQVTVDTNKAAGSGFTIAQNLELSGTGGLKLNNNKVIDMSDVGTTSGVASTDTNNEVVQLPAGAAAEVAASRPTAVLRADGAFQELKTVHGQLGLGTAKSISSSATAFTILKLDGGVQNNTDGMLTNAATSNQVLIPAGTWLMNMQAKINFAANATGIRRAMLYYQAAQLSNQSLVDQLANSAVGTNVNCSVQDLVVTSTGLSTDVIDVRAAQDSGAALNVSVTNLTLSLRKIIV